MKILLGYYDKDGRYIGKKLDTNRRKKFYVVLGTLRRKIAEHADQSPYKTHERIVPYSKNYSDRPRLLIQFDEYENGRKKKEVLNIPYMYGDGPHKYDFAKRIREHLTTNIRRMIDTDEIQIIYFPDGHDLNLEERRRQ